MEQILHIERLAYGAGALARTEAGKVVFVDGAAPGDTVRAEVHEQHKAYARARMVELIQAGPARVQPTCPLAGRCGGCPWQHVSYQCQIDAKRANVVEALRRIGHLAPERAEALVEQTLPSKRQMGYRNKLELAAVRDGAGKIVLGFHAQGSDEVVAPGTCPLAVKSIQAAPKALQGALRYIQGATDWGVYRVGVRASLRTRQTEVALWTPPGSFPRAMAAKTLGSAIKATSIVRVLAHPGKQRAIKGVEVLAGEGGWTEELCGFRLRASAPSFFQVNTAQAETLVRTVIEGLQLSAGERVADLYCGVGTFTLALAQAACDVAAVESAASSVRDLRRNVEENDAWVDVIGGDSAREIDALAPLDALVVDPPRAGLGPDMAQRIASTQASRLAYVSCDPSTWARDVERLEKSGYRLVRAVPIDLFPQTYHCEIASFFERR